MAAATTSQQNFRKAIKAIKDSTLVGMAKVNSEYKDLNVSILKATNHVECLPKEKHVRFILAALSGSRPREDVAYCIHALTKRLAKTRTWVVALKTLIVIHRALREVDHSFCEELMYHNKTRGPLLNILHFKDDSSPSAWDYCKWIRAYALYIEECLECFRVLKYDFHRDYSRTKKFDIPELLEQLPSLQQLLFRLLVCEPAGAAQYNFVIQYALSIVAAESVRLYAVISDGVITLVDKFFEMLRCDAVRALEIYQKSREQGQRLSEFFDTCRRLEFGRRQKYVKIEEPPTSFLAAMEAYIKNAPQTMLPSRANDEVGATPKLTVFPDSNTETDPKQAPNDISKPSADSQDSPRNDKSGADAPPLIPDLLSWDEPIQEATGADETNLLPPPITMPGSELSSEPTGWELELVTTRPDATSVAQNKRVLDRSTLDSLYDTALAKTSTKGAHQLPNVSSNPFEADGNNPGMLYDPSLLGNPIVMQIASIPHQQAPLIPQQQGHHHQQQQSMADYDYLQLAGIPQQQGTAFMQQQNHQQQQPSMVGYNYLQIAGIPHPQPAAMPQQQESSLISDDFVPMIETRQDKPPVGMQQTIQLPQVETSMHRQQQQKPTVGHHFENPFGNPFMDQGPMPAADLSQSSNLSLL